MGFKFPQNFLLMNYKLNKTHKHTWKSNADLSRFNSWGHKLYINTVQFLWNSFYRKLQQSGDMRKRDLHAFKLHLEQGRLLSPLPRPPPTPDKRLAGSVFPAPPLYPSTPHGWIMWFSGFSTKSEDGLYLEAQKCCSWIRTAFVIMYEFELKW
jgi:hypothetical protein